MPDKLRHTHKNTGRKLNSDSRHPSSRVVEAKLRAKFARVRRVSQPLQSRTFRSPREILRNAAKVRHSCGLKCHVAFFQECTRKKNECAVIDIIQARRDRGRHLSIAYKRSLPLARMKDYDGTENISPVCLKNSDRGSTFCSGRGERTPPRRTG